MAAHWLPVVWRTSGTDRTHAPRDCRRAAMVDREGISFGAELLHVVANHLTTTGYFAVLLPYQRVDYFIEESKKIGLHLTRQILVKQTIKHKFFRGILFFNRKQTEPELSEIIIKDTANNYTPEFSAALKDYYLFL